MYAGPGNPVTVHSQNTQGWRGPTITAERQRLATASMQAQAVVTMIQESGRPPASWGGAPVPGFPNLQQGVLPATRRGGPVHWVHQTPPPGPSGQVPTRNSQLILSSRPITGTFEVRDPMVAPTQRSALVVQNDHGMFGSQHAVSGAPAVSVPQSVSHWNQMSAFNPPGQLMTLGGDFNHSHAQSVGGAGMIAPPPTVRSPPDPTHQGGSGLDRFWVNRPPPMAHVTSTTSMTGDHTGIQMDTST